MLPAGGVSGGRRVGRKWRKTGGGGRRGARRPRQAGRLRWDTRLPAFPARAAPCEPAAGPRWESRRERAGMRGVSGEGFSPRACSSRPGFAGDPRGEAAKERPATLGVRECGARTPGTP